MSLWTESNVGEEAWQDRGDLARSHDDAPAEASGSLRDRAERPREKGEAVFDIADFKAIANFTRIRRDRPERR